MIFIYKKLFFILLLMQYLFSQLPIDLSQNSTYYHSITLDTEGEYLMNIQLSSNTSWEEENNESAILTLFINGE